MQCLVSLVFALLPCALSSDGQDVKVLGALGKDDFAVHFSLDPHVQVLQHDGFTWVCIFVKLRPEESNSKFVMTPEIKSKASLPPKFQQQGCNAGGGIYTRIDQLVDFVNNATRDAPEKSTKEDPESEGSCKAGSEGSCKEADRSETESSPLVNAITGWNDRFFNMYNPDTRKHADLFHARGNEGKHFAREVSLFLPPQDLAARISERLMSNSDIFFGGDGAGKAGTTGASFIAGNVGLGNRGEGSNLMDILFPKEWHHRVEVVEGDDDYTKDNQRTIIGEATTSSRLEDTAAPDLRIYEQLMKDTIMKRRDVQHLYGDINDVDFNFQHRLWRFGPVFDAKAKGGIWHRDTCPFGINGALPEGSIMYTLVYILYTENLDLPTAGTRVLDDSGQIFQLPCEAGKGNMIRSGEDDPDTFRHSGPLNIRSADPNKPAYRVMMQSKTLITPKGGKFKSRPHGGHWRGLGMKGFSAADSMALRTVSNPEAPEIDKLEGWLQASSETITYGIGESNALGSAAYPLGVLRAWCVTRDLFQFLGFKAEGALPEPDKVQSAVMIFGFDHYTFTMLKQLESTGFRVNTIASEAMYARFYKTHQDSYSNINTLDITREQVVGSMLEHEPFDMHLVIDFPPGALDGTNIGTEGSYKDPVLAKYAEVFKRIASRPRGEGTIASVTYLSEMFPGDATDKVLQAEEDWKKFGEANGVRVVILRVADRVYGNENSALTLFSKPTDYIKMNPCRRKTCTGLEPLSRIHTEDLARIVTRMLSMFDIVETHGEHPSMRGSASLSESLRRFPSGIELNVVDDADPDNMAEAELWAKIITGHIPLEGLSKHMAENPTQFSTPPLSFDPNANALMKQKLAIGMKYPTYRHGAAKVFGLQENV